LALLFRQRVVYPLLQLFDNFADESVK